jgi:MFS family permease
MSSGSYNTSGSWWRHLKGYHWFVFILAACGWMFDTMDQQLFTASRADAIKELLPLAGEAERYNAGSWVTTIFIIGWALGGLVFGVLGDRWGRAKTMALTIVLYAAFTGLSGMATSEFSLALGRALGEMGITFTPYHFFTIGRFLTGLGVGGEFAVGAALVAEVMPEKARAGALGMMQALSAVGNLVGAWLLGVIVPLWGWQGLYFVGTFPALIGVVVFFKMREPEKWVAARAAALANPNDKSKQFGSIKDLFTHPLWRRNVLVGIALAAAGVLGLWGAGFWSSDLIKSIIPTMSQADKVRYEQLVSAAPVQQVEMIQAMDEKQQHQFEQFRLNLEIKPRTAPDKIFTEPLSDLEIAEFKSMIPRAMDENSKTRLRSKALMLQQVGAFFGMYVFFLVSGRIGRKATFFGALLMGWIAVTLVFLTFNNASQIWYLWPFLGFSTLAPFGGYAVYLPELFPTRLRSTGISFCYNVGRFITAAGVLMLGSLAVSLDGKTSFAGFRLAAVLIATSYVIGLIALIWAPETANKPLPEDE